MMQYNRAIESYDMALALHENFPAAWYNKGNAYANIGKLHDALACYANSPAGREGCSGMATTWATRTRTQRVRGGHPLLHPGNLLRSEPLRIVLRPREFLIQWSSSGAPCWITTRPSQSARTTLNSGYAKPTSSIIWGRSGSRLPAYRMVTKLEPDNVEAWLDYGETLVELGLLKQALKAFDQAVQVNPQLAEPHYSRAKVLLVLDRVAEAMESPLRSAFALDPDKRKESESESLPCGRRRNTDRFPRSNPEIQAASPPPFPRRAFFFYARYDPA